MLSITRYKLDGKRFLRMFSSVLHMEKNVLFTRLRLLLIFTFCGAITSTSGLAASPSLGVQHLHHLAASPAGPQHADVDESRTKTVSGSTHVEQSTSTRGSPTVLAEEDHILRSLIQKEKTTKARSSAIELRLGPRNTVSSVRSAIDQATVGTQFGENDIDLCVSLSDSVCHTLNHDGENLFGALAQLGVEFELPHKAAGEKIGFAPSALHPHRGNTKQFIQHAGPRNPKPYVQEMILWLDVPRALRPERRYVDEYGEQQGYLQRSGSSAASMFSTSAGPHSTAPPPVSQPLSHHGRAGTVGIASPLGSLRSRRKRNFSDFVPRSASRSSLPSSGPKRVAVDVKVIWISTSDGKEVSFVPTPPLLFRALRKATTSHRLGHDAVLQVAHEIQRNALQVAKHPANASWKKSTTSPFALVSVLLERFFAPAQLFAGRSVLSPAAIDFEDLFLFVAENANSGFLVTDSINRAIDDLKERPVCPCCTDCAAACKEAAELWAGTCDPTTTPALDLWTPGCNWVACGSWCQACGHWCHKKCLAEWKDLQKRADAANLGNCESCFAAFLPDGVEMADVAEAGDAVSTSCLKPLQRVGKSASKQARRAFTALLESMIGQNNNKQIDAEKKMSLEESQVARSCTDESGSATATATKTPLLVLGTPVLGLIKDEVTATSSRKSSKQKQAPVGKSGPHYPQDEAVNCPTIDLDEATMEKLKLEKQISAEASPCSTASPTSSFPCSPTNSPPPSPSSSKTPSRRGAEPLLAPIDSPPEEGTIVPVGANETTSRTNRDHDVDKADENNTTTRTVPTSSTSSSSRSGSKTKKTSTGTSDASSSCRRRSPSKKKSKQQEAAPTRIWQSLNLVVQRQLTTCAGGESDFSLYSRAYFFLLRACVTVLFENGAQNVDVLVEERGDEAREKDEAREEEADKLLIPQVQVENTASSSTSSSHTATSLEESHPPASRTSFTTTPVDVVSQAPPRWTSSSPSEPRWTSSSTFPLLMTRDKAILSALLNRYVSLRRNMRPSPILREWDRTVDYVRQRMLT
eukprot:GSA25T00006832001.1